MSQTFASAFAWHGVREILDTLKRKVADHYSGEQELFGPALKDYEHDIAILEALFAKAAQAAAPLPATAKWISVKEEGLPTIGQTVLLAVNGVVQKETFFLDRTDNDFSSEYFWDREDLEEGLVVDGSHCWMPLPDAPNEAKGV